MIRRRGSKTDVLNILKEKYDMEEEDFLSAELEIVRRKSKRVWSGQKYDRCLWTG